MSTLNVLIKSKREALGLSQAEVAERVSEKLGLKKPLVYQTVQQWEKDGGTNPTKKKLQAVAEVLGIEKEMAGILLGMREPSSDGATSLRRFEVTFSNGRGVGVGPSKELSSMPISEEMLRLFGVTESSGVVVRYTGDSNVPTIPDGDGWAVIKIDPDCNIQNGKLYAFRLGDDMLIKRLTRMDDGSFMAVSDNRDYPPKLIKPGDGEAFDIVGQFKGCITAIYG